jgi:hypothetical protein
VDGQCRGISRDGSPCSARPLPEREWCHWHDPDREEIRRESRQRGGYNRSAEARAKKVVMTGMNSLGNVNDLLKLAIFDLANGRLDPKVANALANLAGTIKDYSITTEYGEVIESQRDELARLRRERSG